jgi:hypothetical protein
MYMTSGGAAMSSINRCKTWLCSQRHISNPTRGSSFQIITFIGLTASREEKVFPINMETYAICAIRTLDKGEAFS